MDPTNYPSAVVSAWSDLIKIGIPSLVAIVSTTMSFIQQRQLNQMTQHRERDARLAQDKALLTQMRRELCLAVCEETISNKNKFDTYVLELVSTVKGEKNSLSPEAMGQLEKDLADSQSALLASWRESTKSQAQATMIGNQKLRLTLMRWTAGCSTFTAKYGTEVRGKNLNEKEIIQESINIEGIANECLELLMEEHNKPNE